MVRTDDTQDPYASLKVWTDIRLRQNAGQVDQPVCTRACVRVQLEELIRAERVPRESEVVLEKLARREREERIARRSTHLGACARLRLGGESDRGRGGARAGDQGRGGVGGAGGGRVLEFAVVHVVRKPVECVEVVFIIVARGARAFHVVVAMSVRGEGDWRQRAISSPTSVLVRGALMR